MTGTFPTGSAPLATPHLGEIVVVSGAIASTTGSSIVVLGDELISILPATLTESPLTLGENIPVTVTSVTVTPQNLIVTDVSAVVQGSVSATGQAISVLADELMQVVAATISAIPQAVMANVTSVISQATRSAGPTSIGVQNDVRIGYSSVTLTAASIAVIESSTVSITTSRRFLVGRTVSNVRRLTAIDASKEVFLVEALPYDPISETEIEVNLSSGHTRNLFNDKRYTPRLYSALDYSVEIPSELNSQSSSSYGDIVISNPDGELDFLLDYEWDARTIVVKWAPDYEVTYPEFQIVFNGTAKSLLVAERELRLSLRDNSEKLKKTIQPNRYLGSGGAEGGLDLKDKPKPLLYGGAAVALEPVLIDAEKYIYQIHDGPIHSVQGAYDRAVALGGVVVDFANYTLLAAATVPPGEYYTCLSGGYIRLGALPIGPLVIDATAKATNVTISDILQEILLDNDRGGLLISDLDSTSFLELAVDAPWASSYYLESSESNVDDVIQELLDSVFGYMFYDITGRISVGKFSFSNPTLSIDSLSIAKIERVESADPKWSVNIGYSRAWRPHLADEISERSVAGGDVRFIYYRSCDLPDTPVDAEPVGWSTIPPVDGQGVLWLCASEYVNNAFVGPWSAPVQQEASPGYCLVPNKHEHIYGYSNDPGYYDTVYGPHYSQMTVGRNYAYADEPPIVDIDGFSYADHESYEHGAYFRLPLTTIDNHALEITFKVKWFGGIQLAAGLSVWHDVRNIGHLNNFPVSASELSLIGWHVDSYVESSNNYDSTLGPWIAPLIGGFEATGYAPFLEQGVVALTLPPDEDDVYKILFDGAHFHLSINDVRVTTVTRPTDVFFVDQQYLPFKYFYVFATRGRIEDITLNTFPSNKQIPKLAFTEESIGVYQNDIISWGPIPVEYREYPIATRLYIDIQAVGTTMVNLVDLLGEENRHGWQFKVMYAATELIMFNNSNNGFYGQSSTVELTQAGTIEFNAGHYTGSSYYDYEINYSYSDTYQVGDVISYVDNGAKISLFKNGVQIAYSYSRFLNYSIYDYGFSAGQDSRATLMLGPTSEIRDLKNIDVAKQIWKVSREETNDNWYSSVNLVGLLNVWANSSSSDPILLEEGVIRISATITFTVTANTGGFTSISANIRFTPYTYVAYGMQLEEQATIHRESIWQSTVDDMDVPITRNIIVVTSGLLAEGEQYGASVARHYGFNLALDCTSGSTATVEIDPSSFVTFQQIEVA